MPSYGYCFRATTRRGGGVGRLYLRVVHGGESRSVTTDYRIFPEEWDAAGRRLKIPYGRNERSRQLTEMESDMLYDLRRMESVVRNLGKEGPHTVDDIMTRYRALSTVNTLSDFTEKLARGLDNSGCRRTAKAYRTATARLNTFAGIGNLSCEQITPALIGDFQHSLKSEGRSRNTISFYMRTLRAIYNKAVTEGLISRRSDNPFVGVYTGVSPTRKRALTHGELAMLSAFDPTMSARTTDKADPADRPAFPDRLDSALAMFLFCYHARGMCFVDMANLKKSDLRGDMIRYRRVKTGQLIELHVLPAMRRIMDWFAPQTSGSRYIFPVITDGCKNPNLQYESGLRLQNQRLKKIASLCGIAGNLSTHCARHSWATVARNAGLPMVVISEGLGHTNQHTTEIYIASLERSVIDHASRVVSEAITIPFDRPTQKSHRHPRQGRGFGATHDLVPLPSYR